MTDPPDAHLRENVAATIVRATVRLINERGVGAVSVRAVCRESGIDEAAFARCFRSANDVLVEIARWMTAAFGTAVDATMSDRHTLHESIRAAQHSFLNVVHEHRETERALIAIRIAAAGDPGIGVPAGSTSSLHDELTVNAGLWLAETSRQHQVTWDLPPSLLASFVSASLTGMAIDHLAHFDLAVSRELVDLIAADLARHGQAGAGTA